MTITDINYDRQMTAVFINPDPLLTFLDVKRNMYRIIELATKTDVLKEKCSISQYLYRAL
jgi:hypothetical protein